eukprot:1629360-Prymnesium_polylepis.1
MSLILVASSARNPATSPLAFFFVIKACSRRSDIASAFLVSVSILNVISLTLELEEAPAALYVCAFWSEADAAVSAPSRA